MVAPGIVVGVEGMTTPRIAVSSRVHRQVFEQLRARGEIAGNRTLEVWSPEELVANARRAHALLAFMPDRVDDEVLEHCPELGIVACALKGYDNFDVEACTRRGVWVTVVPDLLTIPTAELAMGLLIALARNVGPGDRFVRSGAFEGWRPALYGKGLDASTVGILGAGRVGIAVAERLRGFGCARILCVDPEPPDAGTRARLRLEVASLDELLRTSDYIVCAAPLAPGTRHLIDADALRRIRPGCRLVNVGRGSVVDEQAVAAAVADGRLGGYAADVFELEDKALADRPRSIHRSLLSDRERTLFTPHLGSAVADVRLEIETQAARSILQYLDGDVPDGALNRPVRPRPPPGAAAASVSRG